MDTSQLAPWYRRHGRHDLPWRATKDRWAVLVSEVMLQQTPVGRVRGRFEEFMDRWPTPAALAAADLGDVLRCWKGMGYPRRARALWETAAIVARDGWPKDEAGLRALPGIGSYTARALLWITTSTPSPPPRDVNVARVAARASLGKEAWQAGPAELDAAIEAGHPQQLSRRHYVYALFDTGALHCGPKPRCHGCPLAGECKARPQLARMAPPPPPRRQARYEGSRRQLRGAILNAVLEGHREVDAIQSAVAHLPQARTAADVRAALDELRAEGLVAQ